MMNGKPRYVQLKAALVEEKDGARLIVGISDIDAQVRHEEEYVKNLAQARIEASVDALTGVKNRHAYLMAEERLNTQIATGQVSEFAVVVLDVNDLKTVNDTEGHEAGDQFIQSACKIICNTFKHSPVFRVGGDEFAVIAQGQDYGRIGELVRQMSDHNAQALQTGGAVISCGMARREKDESVAPVFERADQEMYRAGARLCGDGRTGISGRLFQRSGSDAAAGLCRPANPRIHGRHTALSGAGFRNGRFHGPDGTGILFHAAEDRGVRI